MNPMLSPRSVESVEEESTTFSAKSNTPELIANARLIQTKELDSIIKSFTTTEDYNARMKIIDDKIQPYLFPSSALIKMLNPITSVKTRLSIVACIGPRLTDPKEKSSEIIDMFRFAEEKEKVEEILKTRAIALLSSPLSNHAPVDLKLSNSMVTSTFADDIAPPPIPVVKAPIIKLAAKPSATAAPKSAAPVASAKAVAPAPVASAKAVAPAKPTVAASAPVASAKAVAPVKPTAVASAPAAAKSVALPAAPAAKPVAPSNVTPAPAKSTLATTPVTGIKPAPVASAQAKVATTPATSKAVAPATAKAVAPAAAAKPAAAPAVPKAVTTTTPAAAKPTAPPATSKPVATVPSVAKPKV